MSKQSGLPVYLYRSFDDRRSLVIPFSERRSHCTIDILTPYGFSGFTATDSITNRDIEDWTSFCVSRGYTTGYIGLHPLWCPPEISQRTDCFTSNHVHLIDLLKSEEKLLSQLRSRRRSQISLKEENCSIVEDSNELRPEFIRLYSRLLERVNASGQYNFSTEVFNLLFEASGTRLIGVRKQDVIVSVSLFTSTNSIADFYLNASDLEGREFSSVIMWHAILHFKKIGIPIFNLGGGIRPNDGVDKYKSYFGGREVSLFAIKQIYDPKTYASACREKELNPEVGVSFFPPYYDRS